MTVKQILNVGRVVKIIKGVKHEGRCNMNFLCPNSATHTLVYLEKNGIILNHIDLCERCLRHAIPENMKFPVTTEKVLFT